MEKMKDTTLMIPSENDPKNWQEDFPHENGNYVNTCIECGSLFIGHKRRNVCKMCTLLKKVV